MDPAGLDPQYPGDPDPNDAPCATEWCWQNRWYNAHGYFWGGSHWSVAGDPVFFDESITDDVNAEAGISLVGSGWSWANKQKVAYGAAKFGQKLSGGMAALKALLGGYAVIHLVSKLPLYCRGACAPPSPWTDEHAVYFLVSSFSAGDIVSGAQGVVHELAHIIDWQGGFSRNWPFGPLTDYARTAPNLPIVVRRSWEVWAEAVTVWVFGSVDVSGGFATSYMPGEVGRRISPSDLTVQMDRLHAMLEGW